MKPTAIIQIRTNSKRLPGKMIRPFYREQTIPDLIIERIEPLFGADHIVVATTTSSLDDPIREMAGRHGVKCFSGSEMDVLGRFLGAIDLFELKKVIRICADNPFLRAEYLSLLMDSFDSDELDYATFAFPDGTPIALSHIGLFAEMMTAEFLRKINQITQDPFFHEHVTNYVYTHRDEFRTRFIPVPEPVNLRRDIRLTIDTATDFENLAILYKHLRERIPGYSVQELVHEIDTTPGLIESMQREIARNTK